MNCTECKELLVAYVEGLLDESQKQQIAEHLKDCSLCQAESIEVRALRDRLVKNGKVLSDSRLEDEVLNQIIQEQNTRLKTAQKAGEGLRVRRTIMKSPFFKIAAAAVILIAVLIVFNTSESTITFGQVVNHFLNARTVIFDALIGEEEGNPVMHETIVGSRIRRTISNLPGMTQIIDLETGRMLVLQDSDKTAAYVNIQGQLLERTKSYIDFVREVLMELKDSQKVVELGEQEIDGKKAIGFAGSGNNNQELKIWADPKTAVPIRVELRIAREFFVVFSNFKFDAPVDDALVSMDVPTGYILQEGVVDFTKGTEEDFIESLRIWATLLLDGRFPNMVGTEQYMKSVSVLGEKLVQSGLSDEEIGKVGMNFPRGMFFLQLLEPGGKYTYAGKGVKLGEADKAIFWYRPKDSETYRVIYGDLSAKDVAPENLPK